MDYGEYERGKQDPYELPGSGPINWDFQRGQMEEQQRLQDLRNGVGVPPPSTAFVPSTPIPSSSAGYSGPVYQPRKSMLAALFLPLFFGPLGLFYATTKGALILIGVLVAVPMITRTLDNAGLMYIWLEASMVVSIVWSLVAVTIHNKRAAGANRAAGFRA